MCWQTQHVLLHHSETNIVGLDPDNSADPIARFSPKVEHKVSGAERTTLATAVRLCSIPAEVLAVVLAVVLAAVPAVVVLSVVPTVVLAVVLAAAVLAVTTPNTHPLSHAAA